MKRIIALVLILLMLLPAASACSGKPANSGTEAPITEPPAGTSAPTQAPTEEPVITAEPTEAPAPTEDPTEAEALRIAAEHGLSADDLRGEYGLFIRFSEPVEGKPGVFQMTLRFDGIGKVHNGIPTPHFHIGSRVIPGYQMSDYLPRGYIE